MLVKWVILAKESMRTLAEFLICYFINGRLYIGVSTTRENLFLRRLSHNYFMGLLIILGQVVGLRFGVHAMYFHPCTV